MKIVQFMASTGYGGAEKMFVTISNQLAKHHTVYAVVFSHAKFIDKFNEKVQIVRLHSHPSRYNPLLYYEILRHILKINPDIVHTHSAKAAQIVFRLWKIKKFPFIATKHNTKKSAIFDKVPVAVGVSKEVLQTIQNPNKFLIYNGIEAVQIPLQSKFDEFTCIAVGALRKVKNFDNLVESFAKVNFPIRLLIVGEGEERKNLERIINTLRIGNKIKLLGYRTDVPQLLAKSHVQVIHSHREGLSLALLEGLFYSNVVISRPISGSREFLPENFLYSDFVEKITDVYKNYERYKNAFDIVKSQYQPMIKIENCVEQYVSLYRKLI